MAMHIKVPGKLLNGGATATAKYNWTDAAEIKWGKTWSYSDDNITKIESADSYIKLRLENAKYGSIISSYQGVLNGWINTQTWHVNCYFGVIMKYTFDDKEACDDFLNWMKTAPSNQRNIFINCNLAFDNTWNDYQQLKTVRTSDTVVYATLPHQIGKVNESNYVGGAWYQLDNIGQHPLTCTLELEFFDPWFNDPEMQGFGSAPDVETAAVYYRKLFKRLKPVTATKTLYCNSYILNYLTDEDKKIATDKGWTLA